MMISLLPSTYAYDPSTQISDSQPGVASQPTGMRGFEQAGESGARTIAEMINRMKDSADPKAEGLKITLELVDAVKNLSGIKGVHLQAIEAEGLLPDIIKAAGLLPRPEIG